MWPILVFIYDRGKILIWAHLRIFQLLDEPGKEENELQR
jgi:hypothetical protein